MVSPARALKFLVALAVILNFSVVTCFLWTFVWLFCSPLGRRVLKREEDRLYAAYAWVIAFFCNQWLDTEVRTCKRSSHLRVASALGVAVVLYAKTHSTNLLSLSVAYPNTPPKQFDLYRWRCESILELCSMFRVVHVFE